MPRKHQDHEVTIRKMPWLLRFTKLRGNANGWCFMKDEARPDSIGYKILIDTRLKWGSLAELETICHEVLHASFPDAAEEHISEAAKDLARILWSLGFRRSPTNDEEG